MAAGSEVISNDVVRKVEIEEKCDLNGVGDGNVGGNGNGKEDSDDSSYVFVGDGIEVSAADPDDTGGVSVAEIVVKSDLLDDVEGFKKDELGIESGEVVVDPVTLETNGVVHESVAVTDAEVKGVNDDVDLENGSSVDPFVVKDTDMIVEDVNGHLDKIVGEVVESTKERQDANGIANGEEKTDEIVSEVTFDSESTLNSIESSQETDFELESTIKPTKNSKSEVTVTESVSSPDVIDTTDDLESTIKVSEGSRSQETVTESMSTPDEIDTTDDLESTIKSSEGSRSQETVTESVSTPDLISTTDDLDSTIKSSEGSRSQVTVTESLSTPDVTDTTDELLTTENPLTNTNCEVMVHDGPQSVSTVIENSGCGVSVDGSAKPSEDLECQVTDDGSESSGSLVKEQEDQLTVNGLGKRSEYLESKFSGDVSESCESRIIEQECKVSVNEPESIGSLVDNQECPVSVDESEPSGNHTEKVDSNTIVKGTDEKSEEHQELFILNSEGNVEAKPNHVCNGIQAEHQCKSLSTPCPVETEKAGSKEIGSRTESEVNPNSGVMLNEEADARANGQVGKFDGSLQMREPQVSGTEADEDVPFKKEKLEEMHENQVEGSSVTLIKSTEYVETVENIEEVKEQVKVDDEVQEADIVQDDLNLEDNTTKSTNEAEVPLGVETNVELITHENISLQYEVSNGIYKPEEGFPPGGSSDNVEFLPSIDPVPIECKNGDLLVEKDNSSHSNPDELALVKQEVEYVPNLVTEYRSAEDICCKTGIENVDVPDDEEKENEVKDAPVEFVAHLVSENMATEVMTCGIEVKNVDVPDDGETETEVKDAPVEGHSTLSFPESYVNPGAVIEFGSIGRHETTPNIHNDDENSISVPAVANGNTKPSWGEESDNLEHVDGSLEERNRDTMSCPEVEDIDATHSDEIPTSSVEGSVSDTIDVQNEETENLAYNFLIKIPRFEDESFRDQIRSAQLLVEEKTRIRDSIRVDIQGKRTKLRAHNEAYNAAKLEETAARRLVRLKRQEIESVQIVINRMKNAMSVEDIDNRIFRTEQVIQHETLDLKDEKQFIREIKQLKTLRDQLASNMGTKEEVRQAMDEKDQNEERMKILRKELDSLKDKVSKAEAVVKAVGKKYDEENRKERELHAQFRVADEVRQKAYAHLNSLKKLSYDKNKNFRLYKEDAMAARDFVSRGDKDALHRLCANQMEVFMEQWNNNDEFRKEYVSRCKMNASRRQKAFEGSSLIPDDVAPVLPSNDKESVYKSLVSIPTEVKTVSVLSANEHGKVVSSTENNHADNSNKSVENLSGEKNQTFKTKGPAKPTLESDVAMVAKPAVFTEAVDKKEEETTVTEEEFELAKKDEELKKAEIEAKLKEQRRLEEKAKALEALERKKRNAEKAQLKAELRARKEAEQKEKEREKRLRKKEKKASGGDGSINGEEAANSESSNEAATKEIEPVKENIKKKAQKPPAHFFSKQLKPKPIPPPLVNRNKKRWQLYGKIFLAVVAVLALFFIGNTGLFSNLKVPNLNGPI